MVGHKDKRDENDDDEDGDDGNASNWMAEEKELGRRQRRSRKEL